LHKSFYNLGGNFHDETAKSWESLLKDRRFTEDSKEQEKLKKYEPEEEGELLRFPTKLAEN